MKTIYHWKKLDLQDIDGEIWRPISGSTFYAVSNLGRVKGLDRITNNRFGVLGAHKRSRILRAHENGVGYPAVIIYINNIPVNRTIHKLVAIEFLPNPNNLPCACHVDDDRLNPMATNLFWGTYKDNSQDASNKGRFPFGEDNHNSKLSNKEVIEIRTLIGVISYQKIADKYGVSKGAIAHIAQGKSYKSII